MITINPSSSYAAELCERLRERGRVVTEPRETADGILFDTDAPEGEVNRLADEIRLEQRRADLAAREARRG